MKVEVTEQSKIQLTEVFNGITLKSPSGETMEICMRDSGFEFNYQGKNYFAKEGYVEPFHKSVRGNEFVSEHQHHHSDEVGNEKISDESGCRPPRNLRN